MKVQYDLHLHSCLSPCGDEEMTPCNIVNMAALLGFQMIALTDHNSCRNVPAAVEAGKRAGICVIPGMELCTNEEAHMVCLFPSVEQALLFQEYVEQRRLPIPNRPDIFGRQLVLDEEDRFLDEERNLLIAAADISACEGASFARKLGGAAFPAHIDKGSYSLLASLGTLPEEAGFCAAEITARGDIPKLLKQCPALESMLLLLDSDAHSLETMQDPAPWLDLPELSPECLMEVLNGDITVPWGRE